MNIPPFVEENRLYGNLPISVRLRLEAWADHLNTLSNVENRRVLASMAPSAIRGLFMRQGRGKPTRMQASHKAFFDFKYPHDDPKMRRLYEKAKVLQWNGSKDLDWKIDVDPMNPEVRLIQHDFVDWNTLEDHGIKFNKKEKRTFLWSVSSWMLSQFLHGEQGALMAAAQVTEATPVFDGKYYGATQVMDEARHVEVFTRYLDEKLNLRYDVNDSLFTIIDGLMTDSRWDIKFLGMQILVEGLALGAFSTMHKMTNEPLLKELLRLVIQDEARHVNYGLLSLRKLYTEQFTEKERREREDWAFEVVVLMRNRFLAHELYEESFAHRLKRRQWNQLMDQMPGMGFFRQVMFKRMVPNLRAIGLLTPRIMPRYAQLGLGQYFDLPASDTITASDLISA